MQSTRNTIAVIRHDISRVANKFQTLSRIERFHMPSSKHPLRELLNESTPTAPSTYKEVAERLHLTDPAKAQQMSGQQTADTSQTDVRNAGHEEALEIFVPVAAAEDTTPGEQEVRYEVRQLPNGNPVLPIYTSESLLANSLGDEQSYARIEIIRLLKQIGGRVPLVVNPVLTGNPGQQTTPSHRKARNDRL